MNKYLKILKTVINDNDASLEFFAKRETFVDIYAPGRLPCSSLSSSPLEPLIHEAFVL